MAKPRVCFTIHRDLFRNGIGCPADRVDTGKMGVQYAIRPARGGGFVDLHRCLAAAETKGICATPIPIDGMSSKLRTLESRQLGGICGPTRHVSGESDIATCTVSIEDLG